MEASYPTADCDAEALRLDLQPTGNIWSALARRLLGGKHTRAPAEAELLQLIEEC